MTDERRDLLVGKYTQGLISDAEMTELNLWLNTVAEPTVAIPSPEETIKGRIFQGVQQRMEHYQRTVQRRRHTRLLRIAASVVLVMLAGYISYLYRDALRDAVDPVVYIEQTAPPGTTIQIMLHDGSTAWLNSASTLRYPRRFNRNTRHVYLDGEAFFDVKKDPSKPFRVHAGEVAVRVTGTSFNVQHYDNEPVVAVTLVTGRVAVEKTASDTAAWLANLLPNEQFLYDKHAGTHTKHRVDAALYAQWTTGELKFENASLAEIARALERRYDKKIILHGSLDACRVTTRFGAMPLEKALTLLSLLTNTTYRINGHTITLEGHGCTVTTP